MKPMWTSYGGRARSRGLTDVRDLPAALARIERWALPVAILTLFAYPNPLVPAAFAIPIVSGGLRLTYGRLRVRAVPVDAFVVLLSLGTLLGLAVAHQQDAAMLRFTGVVGALATFYALRGYIQTEREVRQVGPAVLAAAVLGIFAVLALLRGVLPDSPVTSALGPLLAPFSIFPGVSGDTLDVNARFTVHQYGLAHVLLVASAFAVAGIALSGRGSVTLVNLLALVVLMPLLLASQARGAFLALALASTVVAAYRTRLAWMIPPLAVGLLYVLLQRGTISRGVESEWLSQRLGYWTGTLSLLGDVPLTGAGLGMRTFAEVFAWYHQLPDPYQVSHTHNVVVQAYAEQGLLGAIGMLGLLVVGIVVSFRALTRATGPSRWLVGGAAGGFLGSAVYGMTDQVPSNNLSLALVLAMLALTVSADLSSINGGSVSLFDDGAHGDGAAGDNEFGLDVTIDAAATPGSKSLPLSVSDGESRSGSGSIALTVLTPTSPTVSAASAAPASVPAGNTTHLAVTVAPGTNPASSSLAVTVDTSAIGGAAGTPLFDDGAHGDGAAGDNVFGLDVTVSSGTATGSKSLPVSVSDSLSRTASGTITLGVTAAPLRIGQIQGNGLASPYAGNGQIYTTLIEAATGRVMANLFPAKAEAPYQIAGIITAAVFIFLAFFPVGGLMMNGNAFLIAVLLCLGLGIVAAVPLFMLAAWIAAKV